MDGGKFLSILLVFLVQGLWWYNLFLICLGWLNLCGSAAGSGSWLPQRLQISVDFLRGWLNLRRIENVAVCYEDLQWDRWSRCDCRQGYPPPRVKVHRARKCWLLFMNRHPWTQIIMFVKQHGKQPWKRVQLFSVLTTTEKRFLYLGQRIHLCVSKDNRREHVGGNYYHPQHTPEKLLFTLLG